MADPSALPAALARIQQTMAAAQKERAGHLALGHAKPVTLIAVSKRQPLGRIAELYDLGVRDFGENYVQALSDRAQQLAGTGRHPRWHLIGHLQKNKVAQAARVAPLLHTVDSLPLAQKWARSMADAGVEAQVPVLMQVRLVEGADAPGRPGVAPEAAQALATALLDVPGVRLVGLMGVPPQDEPCRPHFARLAHLQHEIRQTPAGAELTELSMGMSDDFREAILEGATMVRVGSALFGPRTQTPGESP
jgi:pyridoxal phosphate enzyme (YggS family)